MSNLIYLPIAVGIFGGAFLGYWSSRPLAFNLSKRSDAPRLVLWCAAIGALLMALPAFFISFIVGGSLGGAWADAALFGVELGAVGVPLGLALGIAVIFGGGLAVGVVIGGLFGLLLAHARHKFAAADHSSAPR
jgi:hypothetical protein